MSSTSRPWTGPFWEATLLEHIHSQALHILSQVGVKIPDPASLELMGSAGCRVDPAQSRVWLPDTVVETCLSDVPRAFTLGGRRPMDDLRLDGGSTFVRPQSGCPFVMDLESGACRPALLHDVAQMARLNDRLPHIPLCSSLIYPNDVPVERRDVLTLATLLRNTRKHIYVQPYEMSGVVRMNEMAQALVGGAAGVRHRPPITLIVAPTSPLVIAPNEAGIIRFAAGQKLPMMLASTPQRGATGPITLAGQVLLTHAENLACFVLAQLAGPGTPVTYGIRPATLDLRTAASSWGGVEWGLASGLAAQLAQHLGLVTDVVGMPTDSKLPDAQAGLEKGFNAALTAILGGNIIAGAGFLDTIMAGSFEQLVLDDDLAGMLLRTRQGIEADVEHLALEAIERVGPAGHYLGDPSTLRYMRSETFQPAICNRQIRAEWEQAGSRDAVAVARERVRTLLAKEDEAYLPAHLSAELDRLARD